MVWPTEWPKGSKDTEFQSGQTNRSDQRMTQRFQAMEKFRDQTRRTEKGFKAFQLHCKPLTPSLRTQSKAKSKTKRSKTQAQNSGLQPTQQMHGTSHKLPKPSKREDKTGKGVPGVPLKIPSTNSTKGTNFKWKVYKGNCVSMQLLNSRCGRLQAGYAAKYLRLQRSDELVHNWTSPDQTWPKACNPGSCCIKQCWRPTIPIQNGNSTATDEVTLHSNRKGWHKTGLEELYTLANYCLNL